jgi:hypothetical protein
MKSLALATLLLLTAARANAATVWECDGLIVRLDRLATDTHKITIEGPIAFDPSKSSPPDQREGFWRMPLSGLNLKFDDFIGSDPELGGKPCRKIREEIGPDDEPAREQ